MSSEKMAGIEIWDGDTFVGSLILNLELKEASQENIGNPLGLAALICSLKPILDGMAAIPEKLDTCPPDCKVAFQLGMSGFVMLAQDNLQEKDILPFLQKIADESASQVQKEATEQERKTIEKFIDMIELRAEK